MNTDTGDLYVSLVKALEAGERREDLIELRGTPEQAEKVSRAVKAEHRRRQKKAARKARKRNRKS